VNDVAVRIVDRTIGTACDDAPGVDAESISIDEHCHFNATRRRVDKVATPIRLQIPTGVVQSSHML